jgi:insulysin
MLNETSGHPKERTSILGEIALLVASYIRIIKTEMSENIWKEIEAIDRLHFEYSPSTSPSETVMDVAHALHLYPVEEVMAAKHLMYEYDEDLIRRHLAMFSSDQLTMMIVDKSFAHLCTQTEKWYGTKYGIYDIPKHTLNIMKKIEEMSDAEFREMRQTSRLIRLKIPDANKFIPKNFDLIPPSAYSKKSPQLVLATPQTALWYKQMTISGIPSVNAKFAIYSPKLDSLRTISIASLYADMILAELHPIKHAVDTAGSEFKIYCTDGQFVIQVDGFSDKIEKILEIILVKINTIQVTLPLYDRVRAFPSVRQQPEQPYGHAIELVNQILYKTYYTSVDQFVEISKIKFEEFTDGLGRVLGDGLVLESLIEGNLTIENAKRMQESVANAFGIDKNQQDVSKVGVGFALLRLDEDIRIARRGTDSSNKNGAVVVNIQTGWLASHVDETVQVDLENVGYLSVVAQIVGQRFFDSLRTKQQLGYTVGAYKHFHARRAGLMFMVQSTAPTAMVEERIMEFIHQIPDIIVTMSDDDFKKYVSVVLADLNAQPKSLSDTFTADWVELKRRRFHFESNSHLIPVVDSLTKEKLIEYVVEKIIRAPKVIATIAGSEETNFTDTLIQDELDKLKSDPQTRWVYSNTNPVKDHL